jgi:hypothetical protein
MKALSSVCCLDRSEIQSLSMFDQLGDTFF